MSKEAVQAVIGKAVTDSKFREALFTNPEEALAGYELTQDEMAALKSIDAEGMESLAGSLDERISKAFIIGMQVGDGGPSRTGGLRRATRKVKKGWRKGGPLP